MKNMTLKNITAACHGTFHGDSSFLEKEITGVAIDSQHRDFFLSHSKEPV